MIKLYGKTYARDDSEAVDSLFDPGGTVNGFYRIRKDGVLFLNLQKEPRAYIRRDGLGPVSVHKTERGLRYMFSYTNQEESWLGIPSSYCEQTEGARQLARTLFPKQ